MIFQATEEQAIMKETFARFLESRYSFDKRRAVARSEPGFREDIWQTLATDLGLLSATIPIDCGGLGGSGAEQMIIMECAGRALMLEPLSETLFQSAVILQQDIAKNSDMLAHIAAGDLLLAVAMAEPGMRYDFEDIAMQAEKTATGWMLNGAKSLVVAGPWVHQFIVAARTSGTAGEQNGLSLFKVPANHSRLESTTTYLIDERRASELLFVDVELGADALIGSENEALPILETMRDHAIAAQAAEAVGLLERLVDDTVSYCKEREQFGQKIAKFQALQYRMVDMYVQLELTRAAAVKAMFALEMEATERAKSISAAKVQVAQACQFVGQNAVQLHGAIGMTDELHIGHYFKRATMLQMEHGDEAWHLGRIEALNRDRPAL